MRGPKAAGSLRSIAAVHLRRFLFSVSYAALGVAACETATQAPTAGATQTGLQLPAVVIAAPETKRSASRAPAPRANSVARARRPQAVRRPEPATAPKAFAVSQDARTGTVGVYANSTSVATKTNTPLIDVPQSLSVI